MIAATDEESFKPRSFTKQDKKGLSQRSKVRMTIAEAVKRAPKLRVKMRLSSIMSLVVETRALRLRTT